ncbi:glycosyltransferase family 4 protein [Acidothermaceae bacterium B102]|nr:glycosyltransferase family 4 protein [Acidothermaceae bacterium B102]
MGFRVKIALVYDAIYPYSLGGGERRFHELALEMTKMGHEVHLYGQRYWTGGDRLVDGLHLHGLTKARPLYTATGRRSITQALAFGVGCLRLFREDFDIIDCCGFPYFSLFVCRLVSYAHRKTLFSTWHEVWGRAYWHRYLGMLGGIGWCVELAASRMPDVFVAVSEQTATDATSVYGLRRPVTVSPNGVAVDEVDGIVPSPSSCDVLFVGRLMDFKNVDQLLRATVLVRQRYPEVSVHVLGQGPMLEQLVDLTQSLGLADSVTFLPPVPDHEGVIARMKSAKVLALPSSREGFGMVLLEALASGTPVLTSNHPGNAGRHLVTADTGLATGTSPQELADGLLDLLDNPRSPAACRGAASEYSWQAIAERLVDVYEQPSAFEVSH